ncbi:Uncharacterized protein FWK35_00000220 [Aphis craccivora]|uniref:Uncharacterized protein n=1 Tax=Aphis craccivora TaxID=307492 RepID=A0A6G0ZQU1_APHCR|nr:Uncharacterized protein FWK35_00000220 [Aphis craccivora]
MLFNYKNYTISDSERSDECIDITMIIASRNNAPISNFGGGFQCKSEYPWYIIENKEKQIKKKKNDGKRKFLSRTSFRQNRFFLYGCNSKTNHCKYLKFSPNVNRKDNDLSSNDFKYFISRSISEHEVIATLVKFHKPLSICNIYIKDSKIISQISLPNLTSSWATLIAEIPYRDVLTQTSGDKLSKNF